MASKKKTRLRIRSINKAIIGLRQQIIQLERKRDKLIRELGR